MEFFINGTRRGLGKYWIHRYSQSCVAHMEDCDVFINNKHDGYLQVHRLYQAAELGKKIINIGSAGSDWTKGYKDDFRYNLEKKQLRDVNDYLFWQNVNTTIINFGYFDTERSDDPKMSLDYVHDMIIWVLDQPHRIKEITVTP